MNGHAADQDPNNHDLPLLSTELQKAVTAHPKGAAGVHVSISADAKVTQRRVIDVLNALAAAHIDTVTFADGGKK